MVSKEIPCTLEKKIACMAVVTIALGAIVTRFGGWAALGWVILAYGVGMLCIAYLFAVAPCVDDPDTALMHIKEKPPRR